ncbi:MAG TPA: stage II sporulation protein R, partial [Clostridiales bacterium]|nr:stage II sporulation protein R [Clostridiales bacterium]
MNMNKSFIIKKRFNGLGLYIIAAAVLTVLIFSMFYSNSVSQGLAENLIRLHVVADSDSVEDQALKLEVRDAIIEYMGVKFNETKDIIQTKSIINSNLNNIIDIAQRTIKSHGKEYPVKASL